MIVFMISDVPPKIDRTLLSRQSHNRAGEHRASAPARPRPELSSGQREPRRSRGAIWAAITRQGIISPRRNSPSRGVAATTTPNQRPRISQRYFVMITDPSSADQEHALAEQGEGSSAEGLALEHLEPVDVALDDA
jgi:hypothetical protein